MMISSLERLNHAFSGGIMFVQPTAETDITHNNFPTVSLDYLSVILSLECCIMMLINFYIA